jgi:hypothetical protein
LAALALSAAPALAEEGMWTFDNFPAERMRAEMGWAPDADWLSQVMPATARLPSCSGANVSGEGLVLSNQHCVLACLNQVSPPERSLVLEGFVARAREEETRCPGMQVLLLDAVEDVTTRIEAASEGVAPADFARVRDAEMSRIVAACEVGGGHCEVMTLYQGGRYALYRYRQYDDVRLVFAPEYAVAQFGGDSENFTFPRTSADFAVLRLYRNGAPASTPRHLRLRLDPPQEGEIVIAAGNPGPTSRHRTASELAFERDVVAPWRAAALADARARLGAYAARGGDETRLAIETIETIGNIADAYAGRQRALADAGALAGVNALERDLQARVARNLAAQRDVGDAWGEIARAQHAYRGFFFTHQYAEVRAGERSDLFAWARDIVRAAAELGKPASQRLERYAPPNLTRVEHWVHAPQPVRPDWEAINLEIWLTQAQRYLASENPDLAARLLGAEEPAALAQRLAASRLIDPAYRAELWAGGPAAVAASDDPMIALVRALDAEARAARVRYRDDVEAPAARAHERIARVRFRAFGDNQYPEATFSPRLSYGRVLGWREEGRDIAPFTRMSELAARAAAGGAYALPRRWAEAALAPELVVNFTSSADIISGNSGSALLDRERRVIGIVFDGNRHALGGEYYYDAARNRAISVSAPLIAAALSLYGLDAIASEMLAE